MCRPQPGILCWFPSLLHICHPALKLAPQRVAHFGTCDVTVNHAYWFVSVLLRLPLSLPLENKAASLSPSGLLGQYTFNWVIYKSWKDIAPFILQAGKPKKESACSVSWGRLLPALGWWLLIVSTRGGTWSSLRPLIQGSNPTYEDSLNPWFHCLTFYPWCLGFSTRTSGSEQRSDHSRLCVSADASELGLVYKCLWVKGCGFDLFGGGLIIYRTECIWPWSKGHPSVIMKVTKVFQRIISPRSPTSRQREADFKKVCAWSKKNTQATSQQWFLGL